MASVARVSTRFGGVLHWGSTSVTVSRGNTPRSYYTYSPEPAQPLKRDPKWVSAKEAVKCIKSGTWVTKLTCKKTDPLDRNYSGTTRKLMRDWRGMYQPYLT